MCNYASAEGAVAVPLIAQPLPATVAVNPAGKFAILQEVGMPPLPATLLVLATSTPKTKASLGTVKHWWIDLNDALRSIVTLDNVASCYLLPVNVITTLRARGQLRCATLICTAITYVCGSH